MPVEPPPSIWEFRTADAPDAHGVVGIGADLEPGTLLAAYRAGLFPMPLAGQANPPTNPQTDRMTNREVLGWWSPDPRGILPLEGLRVSRSLRRSTARFEVRVDTAFEAVLRACADPDRPGGWITADIQRAYTRLHHLGWAHSVETWDRDSNTLVGGLYGVAIGGFFAGESMFHRATDASKVALVGLVSLLSESGPHALLDVQWVTPHLGTLGALEIERRAYLERLRTALDQPLPGTFG